MFSLGLWLYFVILIFLLFLLVLRAHLNIRKLVGLVFFFVVFYFLFFFASTYLFHFIYFAIIFHHPFISICFASALNTFVLFLTSIFCSVRNSFYDFQWINRAIQRTFTYTDLNVHFVLFSFSVFFSFCIWMLLWILTCKSIK